MEIALVVGVTRSHYNGLTRRDDPDPEGMPWVPGMGRSDTGDRISAALIYQRMSPDPRGNIPIYSFDLGGVDTMPLYPTQQHPALHYAAPNYTTLHYAILHYTALHYTTLHYTTQLNTA